MMALLQPQDLSLAPPLDEPETAAAATEVVAEVSRQHLSGYVGVFAVAFLVTS